MTERSTTVDADGEERVARRLRWPMLFAALLTVPAIVLEQASGGGPLGGVAAVFNWVIWAAFVLEAVALFNASRDRRHWFARHPLDLALIVFTAPFLPAAWQAARAMRLLRVVRLLRLLAISRRLFSLDGIRDVGLLAAVTVLAGGAAFSVVERDQHLSTWDGIWWAVTTVTTVGYGDVYPRTIEGRVIAVAVMVVGIGFVALLTAAAAQRFAQVGQQQADRDALLLQRMDELAERLARIEANLPANDETPPGPVRGAGARGGLTAWREGG